MRLVCSGWKYHHDTMVMRVVVRRAGGEPATDETVMLAGASRLSPRGGQASIQPRLERDDGRGYASSVQPSCTRVSRPRLVRLGVG
jgi:hypothetical protein